MSDRGGDLLGRFGISADAETVWLALIDAGQATEVELSRSSGQPLDSVRATVGLLVSEKLATQDCADGPVRAVEPSIAVEAQIAREERILAEQKESLSDARTSLAELSRRYARSQAAASRSARYEVILDQAEIRRHIYLAGQSTRSIFRAMIRQATAEVMREALPYDAALAARGVDMRSLVSGDFLADADRFGQLTEQREAGDTHRILPRLPTHMMIFDDELVVLPVDPDDVNLGAMFIHERGVVEPMTALFDNLWAIAQPVFAETAATVELAVRTSRVLELVASGATDTNISRSLGVTTRTVRREVATLRDALGVGSRMEIVPAAVRRGWL